MDFVLEPRAPADATAAARLAAARIGVAAAAAPDTRALWWRTGLAEAVERVPTALRMPSGQEVAPPPRRTRGAMRA
jgi:hypothetical protein